MEREFALLGGGEGARFLCGALAGGFFAFCEGFAAHGAGGGGGRGGADGEGAFRYALVVEGAGGVGGEGAREEGLREGCGCVGHNGGGGGEGGGSWRLGAAVVVKRRWRL